MLSQKLLDLEGNRVGPRRVRVRQTPYLLLKGISDGKYQVRETNVARKAAERTEDRRAYRIARLDIPRNSNSILIGK